MDISRIPRKVLNLKFQGRTPVGGLLLRLEESIRRDSSFLLNTRIRGCMGLQEREVSGGELLERPGPMRALAVL
jgi:hypothetical protein